MNYSLLKSWIGTDKAQTQKHKKMAQMFPAETHGQAQRRAHNLIKNSEDKYMEQVRKLYKWMSHDWVWDSNSKISVFKISF